MKKTVKYVFGFLLLALFCSIGFSSPSVKVHAETVKLILDNGLTAEYESASKDRIITITGYTGDSPDVIIPEKIDGGWVLYIGKSAFENNSMIKYVTIPESVKTIEKKAFKNCTALKTVTLKGDHREWSLANLGKTDDPVSIREEAFVGCTSLEYFEGVFINNYSYPKEVFSGSGLKEVTIRYDAWTQMTSIFNGCSELETINIDIANAGGSCRLCMDTWKDMPKLKTINIYNAEMNKVSTGLNYSANAVRPFANCPSLEAVNIYYNEPTTKEFQLAMCAALVSSDPDLVRLSGVPGSKDNNYGGYIENGNIKGSGQVVIKSEHNIIPFEFRVFVGNQNSKKSLADAVCLLPVSVLTYNGYELEPYAEVTYDGKQLTYDVDYTAAYKDNRDIGTATVTLTGKGDYTGTVSTAFDIIPQTTVIKSITKSGKKYTVSWSSYIKNCGYELRYSTKKTSGYKKLAATTKTSTTSDKLKAGMYIKVRTYVTVNGKKYYSSYSDPVKLK